MFERRVKIFLGILILVIIVLIGRAMQVQVIARNYWRGEAQKAMTAPEFMETSRGSLLDRKGRAIAEDVPCIDACVDFQAIVYDTDPVWLRDMAVKRLRARLADDYSRADSKQRQAWITEEMPKTQEDLNATWAMLAHVGGKTPTDIDEIRQSIIAKVIMRRRYLWYFKYRRAVEEPDKGTPPWYQRMLVDESDNAPEVDQFKMEVPEQTAAHPILRAIDTQTMNYLGKNLVRLPWIKLQPSVHRHYPYNDVAAHVIGYIGTVQADNRGKNDPFREDPLRRYEPNDLVGRSGLEALCEPLLRGKRGRVDRFYGEGTQHDLERVEPVPGLSVQTTIDIELQRDVQEAFKKIVLHHSDPLWDDTLDWMPGAAVVIDVSSGEVLAMVSYPTYDLNQVDDYYSRWNNDTVNRPLMNRATQFALEPGSTVKPIVGLAAMAQGAMSLDGTIECTGYMIAANGKPAAQGRCWVASMFEGKIATVAHHPIPYESPHPTGYLTYPDALERSCNVFFETLADRLGVQVLSEWFDKFGLGRPTGVGLPERQGTIPSDWLAGPAPMRQSIWFSGIGQGSVLATPIQMANVAATIARGGIWERPRLVPAGTEVRPALAQGPDKVDLHLPPMAVAEAKEGMMRVVRSKAGTGQLHREDELPIAGKTGSAQASLLTIPKPVEYASTEDIIKLNVKGETREYLRLYPGKHGDPNKRAFWYRYTGETEDRRSHAWYIGFAPADNPKVAFAVMVEYGGGGGPVAGQVVNRLLDACKKHGYLPK
jgi:penicillin-binding protein 2